MLHPNDYRDPGAVHADEVSDEPAFGGCQHVQGMLILLL